MRKFILLILVACFLLCGCSGLGLMEEHEYSEQEILYSEDNLGFSFILNMESTETEYAKYYFEPMVENETRILCIKTTDKILKSQELGLLPEIYVFTSEKYDGVYISENKLYLSVQDWQTVEYTTDVLLAAYGEFSHYGLAYGYANFICRENKWDQILEKSFTSSTLADIYDLNLLCFDADFVSESDVFSVKTNACDFVQTYIDLNGETSLQNLLSVSSSSDGAKTVSKELKQYYSDKGIEFEPSTIRYGYGGISFDYIVLDELATFYIENSWQDMNIQYNPMVYENFLHKNYSDTKAFYEINLAQMENYRELFDLDDYKNDLKVLFSNSKSLSQSSFYQSGTHTMYIKNIDSLMHEYIHALTDPEKSMSSWETEGFARYFSYRYDYYSMEFLNQDYNNTPDIAELEYVHEYLKEINRPIDMAVDYGEIENIAVYSRSWKNPNTNYVAGSSFVQYLVQQYGEKAVIDSIYGDGIPLPKTYDELVIDWNSFIENTYQKYSKYQSKKPSGVRP